jgi:hypothetical protein
VRHHLLPPNGQPATLLGVLRTPNIIDLGIS